VFLYGAAAQPRPTNVRTLHDAAGRALVIGSKLSAALEAEEAAENQRLAYVALTRAQVRMYLPLYSEKQCNRHSTYAQIQRCLRPLVGRDARFELIAVAAAADPPAPPDALAGFDVPPLPPITELPPVARGGLAMWSYTRLAHDVAVARSAGPSAIEIQRAELDADDDATSLEEVAAGELPPGSDAGLFLHDVLEQVDLATLRGRDLAAWAALPEIDQLIADRARERGIHRACFAHGARLVYNTLTAPLGELPPLAEATALAREVEFAYPIPGAPGRGLVKGFIDALVAYDDDLWVVDYKSDRLANPARAREHALEHYGVQARLYALAADKLRGTRTLRGVVFAFVRHNVTVQVAVEPDTLAQYARWLEALQ
jgi:ATP-dependent exoDNAse (exonuclease V) beta subunit